MSELKMNLNYGLIAASIPFYEKRGYKYIEVPWIVSGEAVHVTLPEGKLPYNTLGGSLVASGEQGFIELMLRKGMTGKFQTVTPCFRDDEEDELHSKWFLKNELIFISPYPSSCILEYGVMLNDAFTFHQVKSNYACSIKNFGDIRADIEMDGIEVGSYGVRSYNGIHWTYGTGIAEPRFSIALQDREERLEKLWEALEEIR